MKIKLHLYLKNSLMITKLCWKGIYTVYCMMDSKHCLNVNMIIVRLNYFERVGDKFDGQN